MVEEERETEMDDVLEKQVF